MANILDYSRTYEYLAESADVGVNAANDTRAERNVAGFVLDVVLDSGV
jgi:hypothetical protein